MGKAWVFCRHTVDEFLPGPTREVPAALPSRDVRRVDANIFPVVRPFPEPKLRHHDRAGTILATAH